MTNKALKLTAACLLVGSIISCQAPAIAGSLSSSVTYPGDYAAGGSLPIGTLVLLQYAGIAHSDAFIDTMGNQVPNSHANILEEFTRVAYITQLFGHPFIIEAELPFATLTNVSIPGAPNNQVQGGFVAPVAELTYYLISDVQTQRWLGLTNYFYFPLGSYNNQKLINVSTPPDQFTDVPEIGYTEGLGKFSPSLKGFFLELVANASIHTNGDNPANFINPAASPPGNLIYDTVTQRASYDLKAYLRYEPKTALWVALGIEKSWDGEQVFRNGRFAVTGAPIVIPQPDLPFIDDDYLRGHLQFQLPLAQDFAIAADIFHDFDRVGGFKEDIGAEIRLTKFFFPAPPASKPTYTK
jgi:hypothetical protein